MLMVTVGFEVKLCTLLRGGENTTCSTVLRLLMHVGILED